MGEKNKKSGGEPKEGSEHKKKENGGGKSNITVVLKADLHCEGCVSKVMKCIRSFDGVETASIGGEHRITVVGKLDPVKLRERVEQKTHKRIELVSPPPKKDENTTEKAKGKNKSGDDNAKNEKQQEPKDKSSKSKSDEKKSKEKEPPPVTTAVLKVHLHCEGCTQKIHRIIVKTKGYKDVKIDKQKELVTVTGDMDMKALAEVLKKHLKREVQILPPPKKEAEKKENAGGEKAKSSSDKGKSGGGGGDKGKNGGGGGGGGEKADWNRVQFQEGHPCPSVSEPGAAIGQLHYNPSTISCHAVHVPQLFSDENPNACSVM